MNSAMDRFRRRRWIQRQRLRHQRRAAALAHAGAWEGAEPAAFGRARDAYARLEEAMGPALSSVEYEARKDVWAALGRPDAHVAVPPSG